MRLAEDEYLDIEITYDGDSDGESATLFIETNDPSHPTIRVAMMTPDKLCLEADRDELDFGSAERGEVVERVVNLRNCSPSARATIDDVTVSGEGFETTWSVEGPFVLAAGDTVQVRARFSAGGPGMYSGEMKLSTSQGPREFPLEASVENRCPVAIANGSTEERPPSTELQTIPLTEVQLYGDESYDPDGDLLRYEWSLVESPPNTSARMTPSADAANPTTFIDLAGTYVYELKVTDEYGLESCESAEVKVVAGCACDIHVQLVWDTPGDEDQTDDVGTNLDLHYAQKGAAWHDPLFDVHSENMNPDWGAEGPSDDPSLDIDDTDGAGPENVNHAPGQAGAEYYTVGVHYVAENGLGDSYATVRIFIDGTLVYENRDKFLDFEGQIWTVARIHWPSGEVEEIDQLSRP